MKKIIFLVLCVLFIYPHNTSSQFLTSFGIKGGITFSNQKFSYNVSIPEEEHKLMTGFNASLFLNFFNHKYFGLTTESGFEQRGYVWAAHPYNEFGNPLGEVDYGFRTNYIFVQLGPKIKLPGKKVTPYIMLMPRISFYLGNKLIYPDNTTVIPNYLDDFKKVMFDAGIGAGIELNSLLPFKISIEANYYPGVITSFSSSYLDVWEHSFNIKVGINFIKDKKKK
jgi:hypothetical protein